MSEEQFRKELGLKIRRIRRAFDWTQADLAKKAKIHSVSYLCEIEKGRKKIPCYTLHLLETALNQRLMP